MKIVKRSNSMFIGSILVEGLPAILNLVQPSDRITDDFRYNFKKSYLYSLYLELYG